MLKRLLTHIAIFVLSIVDSGATAIAESVPGSRFAQLVLPLSSQRPYTYYFSEKDRALVIDIKDTSAQELPALDHYDETLVRRVVVRQLENKTTQARLILRDPAIRATVTSFTQPFRIVIDLFDKDFQEERDPVTGFPLTPNVQSQTGSGLRPVSPEHQVDQMSQSPDTGVTSGKRQLMAPPAKGGGSDGIKVDLKEIVEGPAKGWEKFPLYIYRFQAALYKTVRTNPMPQSPPLLTSAEAMADYAGKLYEFGHEEKALAVFQQLLHSNSQVLADDPVQLWRLAEIHLGKGNYILADGYYQSLMEKHPEHDLARMAALRRLDVEVLHGLERGKNVPWAQLLKKLQKIQPGRNSELAMQVAIRQGYWGSTDEEHAAIKANRYHLPRVSEELAQSLATQSDVVEGGRTGLLAGAMALNVKLDGNIDRDTVTIAASFFKRYRGKAAEGLLRPLEDKLRHVLGQKIVRLVEKGKYVEAVELYEALPADLFWAPNNDRISWAMGEAYRKLNQPDRASKYYEAAVESRDDSSGRFRATLLQLVTAEQAIDMQKARKRPDVQQQSMSQADHRLLEIWQQMPEQEKRRIYGESRAHLEKLVVDGVRIKSAPVIVLSEWDQALSARVAASSKENSGSNAGTSYSLDSIKLIGQLVNRFDELKMVSEKSRAQGLYKRMNPSSFGSDKTARESWTGEMVKLAEEYRVQNDNLEAGRAYALAAKENLEWEGRGEALYKAGLLLFRAGKRDEAVESLKAAADDKSNLLYADLAQKRLSQIEQ